VALVEERESEEGEDALLLPLVATSTSHHLLEGVGEGEEQDQDRLSLLSAHKPKAAGKNK
jgi:hypothetical protein